MRLCHAGSIKDQGELMMEIIKKILIGIIPIIPEIIKFIIDKVNSKSYK